MEWSVSAVVSYKVAEVKPVDGSGAEGDTLPKRLLGRVMTMQDIVNIGGIFEGKDRATFYYQGQKWVLSLAKDEPADEWNALPHGRDEGSYDTEVQVDRRVQRLYIP